MIANRDLTPEEKAKHREWQAAEILRRRGVNGPPYVEPGAGEKPEPDAAPKCPKCGTSYANPKYRRCFACIPGSGKVRTKPVEPVKPPPRRIGLDEAFARPKGPVIVPVVEPATVEADSEPEYSPPIPEREPRIPEYSAPVRNFDVPVTVPEPVVDHFLRSQEMVPPDPIAALRRVVDALDGLTEETVIWVLRSALRMPRGAGR
jgi:hypothetical protein